MNNTKSPRSATATRGSDRPRFVQRQIGSPPIAIGWDRPPLRPISACPVCWADTSTYAWIDVCPRCGTELLGDRGDFTS
jgi:hypothetical protein